MRPIFPKLNPEPVPQRMTFPLWFVGMLAISVFGLGVVVGHGLTKTEGISDDSWQIIQDNDDVPMVYVLPGAQIVASGEDFLAVPDGERLAVLEASVEALENPAEAPFTLSETIGRITPMILDSQNARTEMAREAIRADLGVSP